MPDILTKFLRVIFLIAVVIGVPIMLVHTVAVDRFTAAAPTEPNPQSGQVYKWFNHKLFYLDKQQYLILECSKNILIIIWPIVIVGALALASQRIKSASDKSR